MLKDYREPEDFLSDESFLSWYFQSGQGTGSEWDRWLEEGPDRKQLVQQAIALLESTVIREKELPAGQLQQAEVALLQKISTVTQGGDATGRMAELPGRRGIHAQSHAQSLSGRGNWRWIAAASILIILTAAMVITRMVSPGEKVLVTRFGELTVQHLPDGSEVTMNANSRLRYADGWKEGNQREVWLEGEAFFHVQKTVSHSHFVVHTDRFDVVVTGTQFNVVNRPGRANVMLREGSVFLHPKDGKDINMTPGDFVQWEARGLNKREVQRDSVLAWKDRKLFFSGTPLKVVAAIIEDQYGVKVTLSDQSIGDSTVTGIMKNNNLEVLLYSLEATTDFEVINNNGNILIKAPNR